MRALIIIGTIATLILTNSCFKEDDPVPPHQSGDVETGVVGMTSSYKYQIYYDLGTAKAVKSNAKSDWDLGFSNADSNQLIILNSSKFMWVANLGPLSLTGPVDTAGAEWKFDMSSGNPDSNAVGSWASKVGDRYLGNGSLYIVDRGMDEIGLPQGLKRVVFDSLVNDTFYLRYADFSGANPRSAVVPRNSTTNFTFFNLSGNGSIADIEPPKEDWDLHFTQYTTIYYTDLGEPYPYLVTGVLLNRWEVAAVLDTSLAFDEVDLALAQNILFDPRQDAIGFSWKYFIFSQGTYVVRPHYIYIIRDTEGYFYKLRFISFINDTGEKGFPTFEFARL